MNIILGRRNLLPIPSNGKDVMYAYLSMYVLHIIQSNVLSRVDQYFNSVYLNSSKIYSEIYWICCLLCRYIFLAIYTCEMVIKGIAKGFILNKYTYLRNPWNWLDFVVITSGYATIGMEVGNLAGLRTFRVLRALKTVSIMPGKSNITFILHQVDFAPSIVDERKFFKHTLSNLLMSMEFWTVPELCISCLVDLANSVLFALLWVFVFHSFFKRMLHNIYINSYKYLQMFLNVFFGIFVRI